MATKKIPYVNKFTGQVIIGTKSSGKHLNEDWDKVDFTKNEHGKPVMRFQLNGATVDVLENDQVIDVEAQDGNADTK